MTGAAKEGVGHPSAAKAGSFRSTMLRRVTNTMTVTSDTGDFTNSVREKPKAHVPFISFLSRRKLQRVDTLLWRERGKPNNGRTTPLVEEADTIEHREFPVPVSACSDSGHGLR